MYAARRVIERFVSVYWILGPIGKHATDVRLLRREGDPGVSSGLYRIGKYCPDRPARPRELTGASAKKAGVSTHAIALKRVDPVGVR